jgi:CheY-like chemotaxis protein
MPTRILIADDNAVTRDLLKELLESHDGWEVCTAAENGHQAVMKAAELKPDIIILDLAMDVMDGLRATREIGRIMPSIPILIYTLHDASWLESEAKKAGARKVLSKPDVRTLLSVVESFITNEPQDHFQGAAPAAAPSAGAETTAPAAHVNGAEVPTTLKNETDPSIKPSE